MRSVLSLLSVMLPAVALADGPGDGTWGDGLGPRAPLELGADVAWRAALGQTQLHFVDVHATAPLFTAADQSWSFGMGLGGGLTNLAVPGESRQALMGRSLQASAQFTFFGAARRSFHGVGLFGGGPLEEATMFWHDANEVAGHVGVYYDGYLALDWVDVSMRFEAALNGRTLLHLVGEASVIAKPHERVALHAGLSGGFTPTLWGVVGLRAKPVDMLEIGLTGSIPLAHLEGANRTGQHVAIRPGLEVRVSAPVRRRVSAD